MSTGIGCGSGFRCGRERWWTTPRACLARIVRLASSVWCPRRARIGSIASSAIVRLPSRTARRRGGCTAATRRRSSGWSWVRGFRAVPIAPEFRHLYRCPAWSRARGRVLARAQYCCERCGKPHGVDLLGSASGAWFDPVTLRWIRPGALLVDRRPPVERGVVCLRPCGIVALKRSQLGVAHINHRPGDNRARNLAAWCRECHLNFDLGRHADTRKVRKDRARTLLAALESSIVTQQCSQLSLKRRRNEGA